MIRLFRIPLSTNVERVALALAHKGIPVESVMVEPDDRTPVRRISGQDLVPVIVDGDEVVADSMEIVRYLERRYPPNPLYPQEPARRAEMLVFIDWFNRVWKEPPNQIHDELEKPAPDLAQVRVLGACMARYLDRFEDLLDGRDYLLGDRFSAADCAAFPFLKFGLLGDQGSPYRFHRILAEHQPLGDRHPRLAAWIRRVDRRPRA